MNTFLSTKNHHVRDDHISFDEGPHIYTIDGDSDYKSVTTFVHSHFEHFDADKIIDNMMKNPIKWQQNKYYGNTKQEIKDLWDENRDQAAEAGTKMHYDIECYYNNNPNENNSIEYQYFNNYLQFHNHLKPYRTEWMIWDKELKFAGSIDMVYEEDDGTLSIYDWKRCKEIKKVNSFNKYSTNEIINHLPDTNYWHYALQLNIYKALLEKNYGKKIKDLYLVCLHPESKHKNFEKIKVVDLQNEVKELFEERKIKGGTKVPPSPLLY